jgi:tetratricopeptide (TPR) repeat protein
VTGRKRLLLIVAGVALLAAGGWYAWRRHTAEVPPEIPAGVSDPRVAEAIGEARREVLRELASAEGWGRLGMLFQVHGYGASAVASYRQAERLDPHEPRWPYYHGLTLLPETPEAAIPFLRQAAELCPDSLTAPHLRLAELLLDQGLEREAERYFRQVLGADPRDPRAHLGLGRLDQLRGDWESSVRHLTQARAAPSARKAAAILLVTAYIHLGRGKEAADAERRANTLPEDPPWADPLAEELEPLGVSREMRLLRANRLLQAGRAGQAVDVLRGVVRDHPDALSRTNLGRALLEAGRYLEAEQVLREAVRGAAGAVDARFYLGVALYLQGERGLQQRGGAEDAVGRIREAALCFGRVLRQNPHHGFAHYNLGHCRKRQGRYAEAEQAFRGAVRCKPEFADAATNLAELLARNGRDAEAVRWAGAALHLAPSSDRGPRLLLARLLGRSIFWW